MIGIAAISKNGIIGSGGKIPWHLPEDFKWFKKVTMGHVLVMGRKTFESIGKALPGRSTYVLTRSAFQAEGVESISDISQVQPKEKQAIFLCGGGEIYQQYLPLCSSLYLTHLHKDVAGDAVFPAYSDFFRNKMMMQTDDFTVVKYVRNP